MGLCNGLIGPIWPGLSTDHRLSHQPLLLWSRPIVQHTALHTSTNRQPKNGMPSVSNHRRWHSNSKHKYNKSKQIKTLYFQRSRQIRGQRALKSKCNVSWQLQWTRLQWNLCDLSRVRTAAAVFPRKLHQSSVSLTSKLKETAQVNAAHHRVCTKSFTLLHLVAVLHPNLLGEHSSSPSSPSHDKNGFMAHAEGETGAPLQLQNQGWKKRGEKGRVGPVGGCHFKCCMRIDATATANCCIALSEILCIARHLTLLPECMFKHELPSSKTSDSTKSQTVHRVWWKANLKYRQLQSFNPVRITEK